MRRLLRVIFTCLAALSLLAAIMSVYFGWRGRTRVDAVVAGYWAYTPHRAAAGYYDAWLAAIRNEAGGWTASAMRRGCVAGPDREQPAPQRAGLLEPTPYHLDYVADVCDDALKQTPRARSVLGVRYVTYSWDRRGPTAYVLTAPHATTAAAFLLLPVLRVALFLTDRRRRRRLVAEKVCPACGYDCRATPDRCPECGNAVHA